MHESGHQIASGNALPASAPCGTLYAMLEPQPRKRTQSDLTESEILRAALVLSRTKGMEFSLRELADQLGTWPNTLYSFFPDKRAIQSAVLGEVMGEVMRTPAMVQINDSSLTWDDRLRALCFAMFETLSPYAGAGRLLTFYGLGGASNALQVMRAMMLPLLESGLSQARAAQIMQACRFFVFEMCDLRYATQHGDANSANVLEALDEQQADPLLAAIYKQYSTARVPERAMIGIDLMIAGIRAEVAAK